MAMLLLVAAVLLLAFVLTVLAFRRDDPRNRPNEVRESHMWGLGSG